MTKAGQIKRVIAGSSRGERKKVSLSRTRLGWNQTAAVIIDLSASLHFVRDPYKCGKRHERVVTSIVHGLQREATLYRLFLK